MSLGGLLARLSAPNFEAGQIVSVKPQDDEPMKYEVCWISPKGGSYELGLRFPWPVSEFWDSWAADLLADARPTNSEILERRNQVRLECLLEGKLSVGDRELIVDVMDIGGGGALIELDSELSENESLKLTIETPVRIGDLPCKIARGWPGDPSLYGLEFFDLRERHHLAVVRLLDHLFRTSGLESEPDI